MTGAEWAPQHEVDEALASALIERAAPQLRGARVRRLAAGWDNTVFLVEGRWVFRFPRRQVAVPGVEREIALLPVLAPRLSLPVPVPRIVGEPSDGFPWPYWGGPLLAGEALTEARPPDADRVALAGQVGTFLRVLHGAHLDPARRAGLPVDPMRRADPAGRAGRTFARLDALTALGAWAPDRAVTDFLTEALEHPPPRGEPVLVHGDLHVQHLLLDPGGEAAGIIDWGDVSLADPAVDLSLGYAAFAGAAREAFLAAYGPVPADRELAARTLALNLSATLAEYAASTGRRGLLAESLAGLRRALQR